MHLLFPVATKDRTLTVKRVLHSVLPGMRGALIAALALGVLGAAQGQTGSDTKGHKKSKSGTSSSTRPPKKNQDNRGVMMDAQRVILVFPPDTKGGVSELVSDTITDVERGRLATSHQYRTVYFSRAIPTVRLGLVEQSISQTDVSHPYDEDVKLRKLAQAAGYDMVISSAISDYQFDKTTNSVSVVMSIRLIDFSGEKPVVRSAAASMSSPENPAGNPREAKVAETVVRSLTEKLMSDLLNPKPVANPRAEGAAK